MRWTAEDIQANREYFRNKLRATKARHDVLTAVRSGEMDFILLDTRSRDAFRMGHIPGAWCVPLAELEATIPLLPRDRELATYCSGHD